MPQAVTGGEPAKTTIQLSDAEMADVQRLLKSGYGRQAPSDDDGQAILGLRRARGLSRAARYRDLMEAVRDLSGSEDPRAVQAWKNANAPLLRSKMLGASDLHHDATIASMSVQYANDAYIGEELLPVLPVPKQSDVFYKYDKRSRLAYPDDDIGDTSEAKQITDARSDDSYFCKPRAFENFIGATAVANQDAPLDELMDLTEAIMEGRAFKREVRIAAVAGVQASYPSGNYTSIAAASRWDSAGGGNPIKDLQTADAALWMGRGPGRKVAFSSLAVYNVLSRHPDILGLFQYNGSSPGLATPAMIAKFLNLDDYLVGRARKDTANEGAAASYSRIWPDVFGIVRVATRASIRNAAFGYTFRWTMPGVPGSNNGVLTQQWFDAHRGLGGVYYAKAGEAEDHKVVAGDTGYLIQTPIG